MKTIIGTSNWIIDVNLSTGQVRTFQVSEKDRLDYLGGKGLGLKLLGDRMDPGIDPLGEKNQLAIMMGVFTGTGTPWRDAFSVVTKSPLTGLMVHSTCRGSFARACKTAGYDGLLVSGRAPHPVIVQIEPNGVRIESGAAVWGLDADETQRRLNPDGKAGVLTIGPAGENRVRLANAASGGRCFGRGGLGAVMGAKHLKAIVARGHAYAIHPADPKRFARARHCADDGMNGILPPGIPPDRADQRPADDLEPNAAGDGAADQGAALGIDDPHRIADITHRCNRLGLDALSAAAVLAWWQEAQEKGLVGTHLNAGCSTDIDTALEDMAYRRGFGDEMAEGTGSLSVKYGGRAFARQVKGMELPASDPAGGWGQALAHAVASDASVYPATAMLALERGTGRLNPLTIRAKARWVKFFEDLDAAANSLLIGPLAGPGDTPGGLIAKWAPKWLIQAVMAGSPSLATLFVSVGAYARLWRSFTGLKLNRRRMLKAGARIHVLERAMNVGEGVSRKDDTLPGRMLVRTPAVDDAPDTIPLRPMIDAYYRIRGYDLRGLPTLKTCRRLGIPSAQAMVSESRLPGFTLRSPGPLRLKRLFLSIMLWFVGRAVEAASKVDREVGELFDTIPDGLTFALHVAPHGPAMVVTKDGKGRVRYLDTSINNRFIDLTLTLKSVDAAMLLFTFQEAIVTAVARDRLIVSGDIPTACTVVRILERVEVHLLPKMLASLSVRRYPELSTLRKSLMRGLIYLRALAGL